MTTKTSTINNISIGNTLGVFQKNVSYDQLRKLGTFFTRKSCLLFDWIRTAFHDLQGRSDFIDIAHVYFVRKGQEQVSRAMDRTYIQSEATLMNMRQRIIR